MRKWIELETDASTGKPYLWKCDECGEEVETRWNYCPECGDPKTSKGKSINTLVKALETEHRKLREMQSATDKNVGTTDTISRQAAIDALCSVCGNDCDKSEFVYNAPQDEQVIMCPEHYVLSTLPPAQPAGLATLIKALEQEHKKLREMQSATDKNVGTTDTISRQAAIDALRTCYDTETITMDNGDEYINYGDAVGEIEKLPPAQHIDADGTLWVTVTDIERVTRVIVDENKSKFCRQFYMDAQPEYHEIGYRECADAVLKMWMDNVLTDGEYNRIIDKLNAKWAIAEGDAE